MKPTTHKIVTRLAIELYYKNNPSSEIFQYRCSIINGSEDEDEATKERAKNWHFFRAEGSPIPMMVRKLLLLKCKPTSEDIFAQRVLELKDTKPINERYNGLGRVLHHIQDMSTPSHVFPIYHDMFVKDYFEDFMEEHDCRVSTENVELQNSLDGIEKFKDIYDKAAYSMLETLRDGFKVRNDSVVNSLPYSLFWKRHDQKEDKKLKGFGVYGELHKYFKKNYLPANNSYGITQETLLSIQDVITTQAIQNSYLSLCYLDLKGLDDVK